MLSKKLHNETILMERIAKGDERAFAELFRAYYQHVGQVVQLLVNDIEVSGEIVQEIFTKIWTNRENLPLVNDFSAYLYVLSRNHTLNHIRRMVSERKKQEAYAQEIQLVGHPIDETDGQDYHELLEKAILQLPPQQQKVFVLRQRGMKNPEISRLMNLSIESVKKYQHLALKSISRFVQLELPMYVLLLACLFPGT